MEARQKLEPAEPSVIRSGPHRLHPAPLPGSEPTGSHVASSCHNRIRSRRRRSCSARRTRLTMTSCLRNARLPSRTISPTAGSSIGPDLVEHPVSVQVLVGAVRRQDLQRDPAAIGRHAMTKTAVKD
jgi:hypothetical protein